MRISRWFLVASAVLSLGLQGQPLALTPAQKQKILRGGVLTLFGPRLVDEFSTAESRTKFAGNVKQSGATYLRWLGYFWTGIPKVDAPTDYNARWDAYYATYSALAAEIHRQSPATYAEFATPELVTEEVSKIDLSSTENKAVAALIQQKTGVVLPAHFDFTAIRADIPEHGTNPDYQWSCLYNGDSGGCGPDVYMKNGIPSLSKPQGKAWVLYLAARAIRSGANAIFIVPSHTPGARNPWKDLADTVTKIRAIKPNVIIGTSGLSSLPPPPAGIVPRNVTDFMKTFLDLDIYQTNAQGVRTVAPAYGNTTRVPCYALTAADNAKYLPADNSQENLCIVKNPTGRRPVKAGQRPAIGRNQIEFNPYKLPILLEYDPVETSCGPIYLPNPDPRLTSPCTAAIRHGMGLSMIFPMSTAAIRQRYIQYSYRLGKKLTAEKGFPVYAFGWFDYGEGLEIRKAWVLAQTQDEYKLQKSKVRMMPADAADANGVLDHGLPPRSYLVSNVQGDLDTLRAAIAAVLAMP